VQGTWHAKNRWPQIPKVCFSEKHPHANSKKINGSSSSSIQLILSHQVKTLAPGTLQIIIIIIIIINLLLYVVKTLNQVCTDTTHWNELMYVGNTSTVILFQNLLHAECESYMNWTILKSRGAVLSLHYDDDDELLRANWYVTALWGIISTWRDCLPLSLADQSSTSGVTPRQPRNTWDLHPPQGTFWTAIVWFLPHNAMLAQYMP